MASLSFCTFRAPSDTTLVRRFRTNVDAGEAEAIALALEVQADGVLIDDDSARRFAKAQGLVPNGALAVLIRGKAAGMVDKLAR